jgi:hypothetical protein
MGRGVQHWEVPEELSEVNKQFEKALNEPAGNPNSKENATPFAKAYVNLSPENRRNYDRILGRYAATAPPTTGGRRPPPGIWQIFARLLRVALGHTEGDAATDGRGKGPEADPGTARSNDSATVSPPVVAPKAGGGRYKKRKRKSRKKTKKRRTKKKTKKRRIKKK